MPSDRSNPEWPYRMAEKNGRTTVGPGKLDAHVVCDETYKMLSSPDSIPLLARLW